MAYAFLDHYYIDSSNSQFAELLERTITEMTVPDGVKKIGKYALAHVSSLKKITIPEGVETIDYQAFAWSELQEITLPLSCHTLYDCAMFGLWVAKRIKLGNVKSIGSKGLGQQNACVEYDFTRCDSVPALANVDAFDEYALKNNPKMLVPAALYDEWIVATNWATYADYIVPAEAVPAIETPDHISEGLLIENGVLKGRGTCTDSTIVVPDSVTRIAYGCFENDTLIDTLILPENGIEVEGQLGAGSTLRALKNYYDMSASFGLSTAENLKLISVIGGQPINNYQFTGLSEGIKYDFSRCETVIELSDTYNITVGEGTKIYVPLELYDEWIEATNWAEIAEYIVVAR